MKKLCITMLTASTLLFAQDFSSMRILDGLTQIQRGVELARMKEAEKKDPYHFEKARANRDVASLLASSIDEAGSKIFMVKSFASLSKLMSEKTGLDELTLIPKAEIKKVQRVQYGEYGEPIYYEEDEGSITRLQHEKSLELDLETLNYRLTYLRENKALSCAPTELAKAEVYYDAMAYELSKDRPNIENLKEFYDKFWMAANSAFQKVNVAKENQLECYTGKPFVLELARIDTETKPITPHQQLREEPLMVTARVHFDFDRYDIKKEYIPLLNEVVKILKENPSVRVRIEGFTDDIGPKAYNEKLALRRAQSVKDYLVKAGIPADRIDIAGFGKERYIADNRTPMGRFTNRRAEFIVIQVPAQ
ncbi:MAG: OmpA family protein [Aquificaceae bacterium]|nr:OmpA family protein [Aquificaceae bacterium]